jgi:hypothetical protein
MKYGIVENITDLASCTLATVIICKNLYQELKKQDHTHLRLIQIEEEAPEGKFATKLQEGKLQIADGSFFGYKIIDLSKHLIQFEPDSTFEAFGSGYVRELSNPLKTACYEGTEKAFLLLSEKEGPSAWLKGVTDYNTLDFGEVIEIKPLI